MIMIFFKIEAQGNFTFFQFEFEADRNVNELFSDLSSVN